jgi:DDB1- and CUL4-associated factor 11
MNYRIFLQGRQPRLEDFKLDDDEDDPKFASNFRLSFLERSSFSVPDLKFKLKQGTWNGHDQGQTILPNKVTFTQHTLTKVDFDSRVYNGQFFSNGEQYFCSSQEEIKIYNVSDPDDWKCTNSFMGRGIRWTITDIDISPDQNYLIYSSLSSVLNLVRINEDPNNTFAFTSQQQSVMLDESNMEYGVFSCKFSGNGKEVLVGTRIQSLDIHDLEKKKIVFSANKAHNDDINNACFDSVASQVIYSGSDDSSIKIWDRRVGAICQNNVRKPQGVLIGHREGITNVCTKGDGFHLISNGKDQCMKLWDIRFLKSYEQYKHFREGHRYQMEFDYRLGSYPLKDYYKKLAEDCSLMTFRGHQVLGTLIRCYFSPMETTGQRYVYSGGADGQVFVYDTYTGKTVANLKPDSSGYPRQETVCRDVSWHPYLPAIAATSFNGTVHQYVYS